MCDYGDGDYCQYTPTDGGEPDVACIFAPAQCSPATCDCLASQIADCEGTCVDGPNGPTITCTPG